MRPVIELLQRLLVYSCDASTPSFRTAAPCRNSMLSRVRASVRLAATSKEPKTEQRAAEERERARFWHGVHIRNNGAGEERGRERERRSLRYHNRSRRKRQQEGIEVGHESARHKPRRSAAKGGIAEGEGKDVADALRRGRRTLLERDRLGGRRETSWCEPHARESMSNRSAGRAFGNRARCRVVQTC